MPTGLILPNQPNAEEFLGFAASDETSDLEAATDVLTWVSPIVAVLTRIVITLNTVPTGSDFIVDINKNAVSILSTLLSIDATEDSSVDATTPAVISDTTIAIGDRITLDITQIGSTNPGVGLKVWYFGELG